MRHGRSMLSSGLATTDTNTAVPKSKKKITIAIKRSYLCVVLQHIVL